MMKELGREWANFSQEEKSKYTKMASQGKKNS